MNENFDSYSPFIKLPKKDFIFKPNRFEIWFGGKLVGNGKISSSIIAKVINQNNKENVAVYFDEIGLKDEIESVLIFDEFVTAHDRLQLINIPVDTNASNMAIALFKMTIGPTRDQYYFTSKEAYCCNIFTSNKVISKITFSFSNPEKLIELYQ